MRAYVEPRWRSRARAARLTVGLVLYCLCAGAQEAGSHQPSASQPLERVVVRFTAPELGGVEAPHFIFERELSFEARVEALSDARFTPTPEEPYQAIHVRTALERHVAEAILESLQMTPTPTAAEIEQRARAAEASLIRNVGGSTALALAARAERLEQREVYRVVQRRARASLYLDRMVAPMLYPSEAELQSLHSMGRTPFSRQNYASVAREVRGWYVSRSLKQAVQAYYEGARTRITLTVIEP